MLRSTTRFSTPLHRLARDGFAGLSLSSVAGLNTNVLSLYAKGMSTGDIQAYLSDA